MMSEPAPRQDLAKLATAYARIREESERLASRLTSEDQNVQSMPDASPTKWHLAHTTWFFETAILGNAVANYRPFDDRYAYLFNSYYEALGPRHPRPMRGVLTRPSVEEVLRYRRHVDGAMRALLDELDPRAGTKLVERILLGLNHEQQHQELLLTDIKHAFSLNPLQPAYAPPRPVALAKAPVLEWLAFAGGVVEVGSKGDEFCFDNEEPRHRVFLEPFRLASRLVTCAEFSEFVRQGGYQKPEYWLSDGWACRIREDWTAPLYWLDEGASVFTLQGPRPLNPDEPVSHVSFYEAAAFAQWAGKRLPTEFEWECAASRAAVPGETFDPDFVHPRAAAESGLAGLYGQAWQWTRSSYDPYPGFRPFDGALAEYNGKFMVGQIVLRGSSCATPNGHARRSYRNFFPPTARWQFSGIRLAEDA
jgi:ergothioneine biosynthesis protein EgtB